MLRSMAVYFCIESFTDLDNSLLLSWPKGKKKESISMYDALVSENEDNLRICLEI